jgi:excisionase family DNA binding protein
VVAEAGGYLTVAEVAALLRLKQRRVYALARAGTLPSRRVTGRLLFARGEVDAWLRGAADTAPAREPPPVLAGSHDPLLDWALRESGCGIASFCDGSLDGLARLARGEAALAGVHLAEGEGAWNRRHVQERLAGTAVVLVEWAWRERGLIVAAGNPLRLASTGDLAGRRVIARQKPAGSQFLLERLLAEAGIIAPPFAGVARSEADAALAVADGKADAALGLACMARQFRLSFVPVLRERFDLVIDRRAFFEPPIQALAAFARSAACADKAEELGGYDLSGLLTVHFNAP